MRIYKLLLIALMTICAISYLFAGSPAPNEKGNLSYYKKGLNDKHALLYANNSFIRDAEYCVNEFLELDNLEVIKEPPYCVIIPSGARGGRVGTTSRAASKTGMVVAH